MMMQILTTDNELAGALPIVGSAAYLRSKSSNYGWFRQGDLVLPFLVERRALFNRLVFTHQTISLRGKYDLSQERKFLNQVVVAARRLNVDFIYQPHATAVFSAVPDGAISAKFGSYVVNLEANLETLWANLHGKHRNVIKKAREAGVKISEGPHNLHACYALIHSTMKRNQKLSVSQEELERFRSNLAGNVSFYVASKDNVPQGAAVVVWSAGHTAYYLHGGTSEAPFGGAMNLLHWQAMSDMKARGVKEYDFVGARLQPVAGSKLESIQRFKERFGATLKQGYLWKYPLKPMRYRAFCLLARVNSMAHGAVYRGDIIDEERALA
jgi:lipid II:glycine glycyltransferase (peptidoglycan interpeptide bridge formation enzyme)